MADIRSYRDLEVWQRGVDLVIHSYQITRSFPSDERFGLVAQMRRAVVSIPANVAEGRSRHTTELFRNHLSIALGSQAERETCIELSFRLGCISDSQRDSWLDEAATTGRLLSGLLRALQAKIERQRAARRRS
jgi:four helix bundle protein